ncbi:recombinase family protein [Polaromonas hydrogenivorans]|uniref:Recombinase family protein n=1 Tax=Polaromonas hydrogenivorans TaxID=335476 RepID=A0AAU7LS04_9BURK
MTKTAYSYIRFSHPSQAAGRSQRRQIEECERYCEEHGLTLAEGDDYRFLDEGVSGFKGANLEGEGQLKRFINLVKDGTIKPGSTLIVESLDRLSRDEVITALPTFLKLLAEDIEIVTLTDRKVYRKGCTDTDLIMSILIMSRAHEESATKSKRVRDAYAKKHELARAENKPMGNAKPMWLELSDDKKQYILRPERAAIVQRIYQLAIDGYGKGATSRKLNIEGIPSFKGKTWGVSSLDKVLNNRAVLGEYQPYSVQVDDSGVRQKSGEPIPNYYPAAIDESTFYQAQAAISGRRVSGASKQSANFNVWQGVAKCTLCGSAMHMVNKGKPPKGNTYIQCYQAKKGLCHNKVTRLDSSELVFRELLTMLDSLSLIQDDSGKIGTELVVIEARLTEKKGRLAEYLELFTESPTSAVNGLIVRTETEINALEKQRVELQTSLAAEKTIDKQGFLKRLDLVSYEGRNRANMLLKKLEVLVYIGKGYVVTQQIQYRHQNGELAMKRQEAVFVMAHKDGKVGHMVLDDHREYPGGYDHVAESLLARMARNTPFTSMYDHREI